MPCPVGSAGDARLRTRGLGGHCPVADVLPALEPRGQSAAGTGRHWRRRGAEQGSSFLARPQPTSLLCGFCPSSRG